MAPMNPDLAQRHNLALKAMFQMCGVFAESERSIIRERINAGLNRAKSNGKQLGRPSVEPEVEEAIRDALGRGDKGILKISREMGIGVSVVPRIKLDIPLNHSHAPRQRRSAAR